MPDSSATPPGRPHDPYAALRLPEFRAYILARFSLTLALQMQSTVVGWQVYQLTHDKLSLGLIGLAEAIPSITVSLIAGHVADSVPRRRIVRIATLAFAVCTALLWSFVLPGAGAASLDVHNPLGTLLARYGAAPIYVVIFLSGLARGFISPALFSFMPQLIPDRAVLPNAITWASTSWQTASVVGPALGGLLLGFAGLSVAYGVDLALTVISLTVMSLAVRARPLPPRAADAARVGLAESLTTGLRFVFGNQLILGSISLDLFAVLFGGAVALLPVYAQDILHVGPQGLGFLRAAPGVGSVLMLALLNYAPVRRRAGHKLLAAVAGFGLATIGFAYSTHFLLSLALLFATGAFDAVSVILRFNLLHLYTPEHIKGRVSSVNSIFIGSSNEIGAFESGVAAKLLGTQASVAFGGVMTLLVVAVTAWKAKALRELEL
ncbi:MAG: MFS transporter [Hymenobacteraceae bacterium]|nr:MFS transporter [Hymenobacteraceae bacterium]